MKKHIKVNGKPVCGVKAKRKLIFAETDGGATCLRCKKAVKR